MIWCNRSGFVLMAMLLGAARLQAADVGSVRGVVHDQQHRPLAEVQVKLKLMGCDM